MPGYRGGGSRPELGGGGMPGFLGGFRGQTMGGAVQAAQQRLMQAKWSGSPFDIMQAQLALQQAMQAQQQSQQQGQTQGAMRARNAVGGPGIQSFMPQLMSQMVGGGGGGGGGFGGTYF